MMSATAQEQEHYPRFMGNAAAYCLKKACCVIAENNLCPVALGRVGFQVETRNVRSRENFLRDGADTIARIMIVAYEDFGLYPFTDEHDLLRKRNIYSALSSCPVYLNDPKTWADDSLKRVVDKSETNIRAEISQIIEANPRMISQIAGLYSAEFGKRLRRK
jgi:hypothetical protein